MNRHLVDISIEITSKNDSLRANSPSMGYRKEGTLARSRAASFARPNRGAYSQAKNESDFGLHTPFQTNAGFMHLF